MVKKGAFTVLSVVWSLLWLLNYVQGQNIDNQHYMPPLECYDPYGRPQVSGMDDQY